MLSALSASRPVFAGSPFPGRKAGLTLEKGRLKDVDEFLAFTDTIRTAEYGEAFSSLEKQHRRDWLNANIRNDRRGKTPANHLYVIRDGAGNIVGTTMFHQYPQNPDTAYLGMGFLAPEYRNTGIANWLLKQCVNRARHYGLKTLKMEGRLATVILAAKHGFEIDVESADETRRHYRRYQPERLEEMPKTVPMKLDLRA